MAHTPVNVIKTYETKNNKILGLRKFILKRLNQYLIIIAKLILTAYFQTKALSLYWKWMQEYLINDFFVVCGHWPQTTVAFGCWRSVAIFWLGNSRLWSLFCIFNPNKFLNTFILCYCIAKIMLDKILYNTVLSQTLSPCGKYLVAGNIYGQIAVFK